MPNPIKQLKQNLPRTQARLGGLRALPQDEVSSNGADMSRLAADFWGRVWTTRSPPTSPEERAKWLQWYTKKVDHSLLSKPTLESVRSAVLNSKNTSPGPDGIPFAAWRAIPDISSRVLFKALTSLLNGDQPPKDFNLGLLFLLPKKNTHLVSDTRPLSVTNTDNRTRVISGAIMGAVKSLVNPAQKGFLSGVQGTDHIEALNTLFYAAVVNRKDKFVFFLDTAKAFDSIDHTWIMEVLRKTGFPRWVLNFVKSTIANVKVSPFFGNLSDVWIDIRRGVKQGCPLSPLLFLLSYDPLIQDLADTPCLSPFAFADDLAVAFNYITDIDYMLRRIDDFSQISGLGRNTSKSGIISSLHRGRDPRFVTYLDNCRWPDLKFLDEAVYLGLPIGADVTLEDVFKTPMYRMTERLRLLRPCLSTLPLHKRILLINVFIVSLFSYVCLFFVLPHELWTVIKEAIRKIITPFNGGAYPYEALVCGGVLGLKPTLRDPWAAGLSLLAVRSSQFPTLDKPPPPGINLKHNMFITSHRDSAAHDLYVLSETPCKRESPKVYQAIVQGFFLPEAVKKWNSKILKHIPCSDPPFPIISTNILSIRALPSFLSAFFFSLLSNALPTHRRRRHALGLARNQIENCFLCGKGEDSIHHIFSSCEVSLASSNLFFSLLKLPAAAAPLNLRDFLLSNPLPEGLRAKISASIISLAYASWHFRIKALASRAERGIHWVIRRVLSLSLTTYLSFSQSRTKYSRKRERDIETSLSLICSLNPLTITCYTDGSASPNPGPTGAGVHIMFPSFENSPNHLIDAGTPLGQGTNNLGELWAIGVALFIVSKHPSLEPRGLYFLRQQLRHCHTSGER